MVGWDYNVDLSKISPVVCNNKYNKTAPHTADTMNFFGFIRKIFFVLQKRILNKGLNNKILNNNNKQLGKENINAEHKSKVC